jgi:demethylmenaquinone methyltransferase/2-methoxy-6-polyprenyl-1,4-benzoquinol methylase
VKAYYDRRAPEYDDWYLRRGRWAGVEPDSWREELDALGNVLERLTPARTLDVACGTGFMTRRLRGDLTALDQSRRMLELAGDRLPRVRLVQGDALALPFPERSFSRVVTMSFYGHLEEDDRVRFLSEARRVADELVVVDASRAHSRVDEEWQARVLDDGSEWSVFKRYFTSGALVEELGGGDVLHDGRWFVAVRS